jgi:hypothetical protein
MNTEYDQRARALHAWFCQETGQPLPLHMRTLTMWVDWLLAGHNGRELARVIRYLRREISAGRRNHGSLTLRSLLDIDTFEKDLGLAMMAGSGALDPERRLAPPPDATPAQRPAPAASPATAPTTQVTEAERAERLKELERLKSELSASFVYTCDWPPKP